MSLLMERSNLKSKNGAEVLDSFVLLRHNSLGYMEKNKVSNNGLSSLFQKVRMPSSSLR